MDRLPERTWWDERRAVARRHARGPEPPSDAAEDLAQDLAVAALEQREPPAAVQRMSFDDDEIEVGCYAPTRSWSPRAGATAGPSPSSISA